MTAELTAAPPCCRSCGKPRRPRANQPGYKGANGYCEACNNRWHAAGCPPEGPPPPMSAAERAAMSNAVQREAKELAAMNSSLAALSWPDRAACRDMDTELFFPASPGTPPDPLAAAACASCPVRRECLDFSIATGQHGVWGGLNEDERATLRKRQYDSRRNAKRRVAGRHQEDGLAEAS